MNNGFQWHTTSDKIELRQWTEWPDYKGIGGVYKVRAVMTSDTALETDEPLKVHRVKIRDLNHKYKHTDWSEIVYFVGDQKVVSVKLLQYIWNKDLNKMQEEVEKMQKKITAWQQVLTQSQDN